MTEIRHLPRNYERDLAALKKLSQKINRLIEDGTFYRYPYWQRYNEIRKLNKLYRKLLGRVPFPRLQHIMAAAIILVAGSSCNLDAIKAGLLARGGNTAPTVVIEEGDVTITNGVNQIVSAVVTDPNTDDAHTFKWFVDDVEQGGATESIYSFSQTPAFGDIDGDFDMDCIVGTYAENFEVFENTSID